MIEAKAIKSRLLKQWQQDKFYKAYLNHQDIFPYQVKIPRLSDKILLHQFSQVQQWLVDLDNAFVHLPGVRLIKQEIAYNKMGRQRMPVSVEFVDLESLARYLGRWQVWQLFNASADKIVTVFPELDDWLKQSPAQVIKYLDVWPRLLAVCQFFKLHSKPGCYIRELKIAGVDTKFIESHKPILKTILDQLLPPQSIDSQYTKLSEHGFEKRFGLKYEPPLVRFRLLDPALAAKFGGLSDISVPIIQFAKLDLLLDRIFITENKVNGLAFPPMKNALVIFGLGYGVQQLKQVVWLEDCHIHYWGDIDTHGFAILSQLRGYFPKVESILMDEQTLINCKPLWGEESVGKVHPNGALPQLTDKEQLLYQGLKTNRWQSRLRLEQERIPFHLLDERLRRLK